MTKIPYSELLQDPRWQKKRLEVLSRAEFTCQTCFDSESPLHVHHQLYRKGRKPWEYEDWELKVLCRECHEHAEDCRLRLLEAVARVSPENPTCQLATVLEDFIEQDEGWETVWNWLNCARYPDLLQEAARRRIEEVKKGAS